MPPVKRFSRLSEDLSSPQSNNNDNPFRLTTSDLLSFDDSVKSLRKKMKAGLSMKASNKKKADNPPLRRFIRGWKKQAL